jgi:thioredoxin reductase (NADPH)
VSEYDVVVVGSGPAGLAAGLRLQRHGRRVVVLERESFGGTLPKIGHVDDYPGLADVTGADLSGAMLDQAHQSGLRIELDEVRGIESFSSSQWLECSGGTGYTTSLVIAATGVRPRPLGVPGEAELIGQGVMDCPVCDAGFFRGGVVAVCGAGDAAISEALYLSSVAGRVYLLVPEDALAATAAMAARVAAAENVEIRCGVAVEAILGTGRVEALSVRHATSRQAERLPVDGVVARASFEPNTGWLASVGVLDERGYVCTDASLEAERPFLLVAGDVRRGAVQTIAAAVGAGTSAAERAVQLLDAQDALA